MNYKRIYESIIENRKNHSIFGYVEEHHIIPRCLGGTDDKDNLVKLTAKEHFICHLLLTKMYPKGTNEYYKMCHAFLMMLVNSKNHNGNRHISSRKYEVLKTAFAKQMSNLQSGKSNSQYGTMWIHNITLKECKKVSKDSILEEGWVKGRILNWMNPSRRRIKKVKIERPQYVWCHNKITQKNKKLLITEINNDWEIGKLVVIDKNNRVCKECGAIGCRTTASKFCSEQCRWVYASKNNPCILVGKEVEFIQLYKELKSINKVLKLFGVAAVSHYYKWAKKVILTSNDIIVLEIYQNTKK